MRAELCVVSTQNFNVDLYNTTAWIVGHRDESGKPVCAVLCAALLQKFKISTLRLLHRLKGENPTAEYRQSFPIGIKEFEDQPEKSNFPVGN